MSCGRPSSPRATARSVPATTVARSLPVRAASSTASSTRASRSAAVPVDHSETNAIWQASSSRSSSFEPARHREALVDQRPALLEGRAVVELVGQAEQHPAAQRAVLGRQPVEAGAERAHHALVHLAVRGRLPQRALGGRDRRGGDQLRVADLLGHLHGLLDRGGQLRPHRRPAVGVDQPQQHVVPLPGRGLGVVGHRGVRRPEQVGGLLVGVELAGHLGGGHRGLPGLGGVRRAGGEPVPGLLGLAAAAARQDARDPGVQPGPARRRHRGDQGVADQRVGEAEPLDAVLAHQPGDLGRLEDVEQVVGVDVGHGRERGEVELAADHRGRPQRRDGVAGQLLQAPGEHLLHAGGRVLLGDQPGEVAALAGQPGVLHEVERVAVGALPQRGGLLLGRPVVGHRLEHLGDRRRRAARPAPVVRRAAGPAPRRPRPARRSARGASARWRGPAAARRWRSRRAAAAPGARRRRPSAGRRG